jgi:hypothetical protein
VRELIGPTRLLDPVIRDAATEEVERLSETADVFRAGSPVPAQGCRAPNSALA